MFSGYVRQSKVSGMAVKTRFDITPQMADYYRISTVSQPFLMYTQEPNFRSASFNTDGYGFRRTIMPSGNAIDIDDLAHEECNILIGNSTAFGIGATGDDKTIASVLAGLTGMTWVNLAGRSFASTQEFIQFMLLRHKFGTVRRVLIFSGLTNLTALDQGYRFAPDLGPFNFSRQMHRYMHDPYLTRFQRRLRALLYDNWGDTVRWRSITLSKVILSVFGNSRIAKIDFNGALYKWINNVHDARSMLLPSLERDIANWARFARADKTELSYVLQATPLWSTRKPSAEEQILFSILDKKPAPEVLAGTRAMETYRWLRENLERICRSNNVPFHDANEFVDKVPSSEWIWVDRVHMTDRGQQLVANWLNGTVLTQSAATLQP